MNGFEEEEWEFIDPKEATGSSDQHCRPRFSMNIEMNFQQCAVQCNINSRGYQHTTAQNTRQSEHISLQPGECKLPTIPPELRRRIYGFVLDTIDSQTGLSLSSAFKSPSGAVSTGHLSPDSDRTDLLCCQPSEADQEIQRHVETKEHHPTGGGDLAHH